MNVLLADNALNELFASPAVRSALRLTDDQWSQFLGAVLMDRDLTIGGEHFNYLDIILNTAMVSGPDSLRLAARFHGQCEMHCYVEQPNRIWLADLIQRGFPGDIFRRDLVSVSGKRYDQGWQGVLSLLRGMDDSPVVTSYSVTESFPDVDVVHEFSDWSPDIDADLESDSDAWWDAYRDAFYDEPDRWNIAMDALRKASEKDNLELRPDGFREFRFGRGHAASDVIEAAERMVLS